MDQKYLVALQNQLLIGKTQSYMVFLWLVSQIKSLLITEIRAYCNATNEHLRSF
jgi:hypothetical protein